MSNRKFKLIGNISPAGDQPQAIASLTAGANKKLPRQTLLGVTGSGKTFTIANVIANLQRPTLILAPNKTLAAQLYGEMKSFFPENAVEYFVSYYDYYQPEAYVPTTDTYIEKDASINEHIERMRLSATKSLLEREDTIIVASVSAIYGLGDPDAYLSMVLSLAVGDTIDQRQVLRKLADLQYTRNDIELKQGCYRVCGDVIDIFPADSQQLAVKVTLFGDEIDGIKLFDPLTSKTIQTIPNITIYPNSHYATPREIILNAIDQIKLELQEHIKHLKQQNKLLEAQRIEQRTLFDIEMMVEIGYCSGIENYSRYLSKRMAGSPPPTLIDYLPKNALLIIDESHVTNPQLAAMYKGDRSRKETLVKYGFRLPSALDNRPLTIDEFTAMQPQTIYVSATPGDLELQADAIIEQVIRPTGLLDPNLHVKPVASQVEDVLSEIKTRIKLNERTLITTLTKRLAEDLSSYLLDQGIKARYLHSDLDTVERVEVIRDLRQGAFDVLVGINLLREGLDLPEVSLVAIFDADKEGFLRSERSLIQTIGRAARNVNGTVILYADNVTKSMQTAMDETNRRRKKQLEFNKSHNITPASIKKSVLDIMEGAITVHAEKSNDTISEINIDRLSSKDTIKQIKLLEKKMYAYAKNLEFEQAAAIRDQIAKLQEM